MFRQHSKNTTNGNLRNLEERIKKMEKASLNTERRLEEWKDRILEDNKNKKEEVILAARVTAYNEGQTATEAMCKEIRTEVRNSEAAVRRRINKLEILQVKSQVRMANLFILEEEEEFTVKIDDIQKYF